MFGWFDKLKDWLNGGNKPQPKPQQPKPVQQVPPQAQTAGALPSIPTRQAGQPARPQVLQAPTIQASKQPQINVQSDIQKQQQQNNANLVKMSADQQARVPKVFNAQGQQSWVNKDNAQQAQKAQIQQKINTVQNQSQQLTQDMQAKQRQSDQIKAVGQSLPMPVRRAVAGVSSSVGKMPSDIASGVGAIGATVTPDSWSLDKKFKDMNNWGVKTGKNFDDSSAQLFNKKSDGFLGDVAQGAGQLGGDIASMLSPGAIAKGVSKGAQVVGVAPKVADVANKATTVLNTSKKLSTIPSARYGLQETGNQFNQAKEAGKSDLQAGVTGIGAGATQFGLEKVGLDKFLKPGQGSLLSSVAKRAVTEGVQEGAQTFGSNAWEKTYNADKGLMDDVLRSAAVGAVVGGGVSPVVDAAHAQEKPRVTNITPKTEQEHRAAVDNGIVTPATASSSLEDMVRTAENSSLSPNASARQPEALYHGTNAEFNTFDQSKQNPGWLSTGTYLTRNIDDARNYGDTIKQASVAMENPLVLQQDTVNPDGSVSFAPSPKEQVYAMYPEMQDMPWSEVSGYLQSKGFDGIDNGTDVAVFDTNKIGEARDVRFRIDTALRNGEISEAQHADLLDQHRAMFGDESGSLDLVDSIASPNGQALGVTLDNLTNPSDIQIANGQTNAMDTLFHESVHKALNDYMTTAERSSIVESYARDKRITNDRGIAQREYLRRTEELMSEDFIQYVANQNNKSIQRPPIAKRIADIFSRVLRRLQHTVLRQDSEGTLTPEYLQFYKDLHEGKFAKQEVIDKELRDNTPEELAIRDHIRTLQQQFDNTQDPYARRVINQQIAGLNQKIGSSRVPQTYRTLPPQKQKIVETIKALSGSRKGKATLGKVSSRTANIVGQISGIPVKQNANIEIKANSVRHILNKHGEGSADAAPLTDSDLGQIVDVINNPDSARPGDFVSGKQRVRLMKRVDSGKVAIVEAIKEGNALNVVSFYNASSPSPDADAPRSTPKVAGESKLSNNVANNPRIVKGRQFREKAKMTRELRRETDRIIHEENPELMARAMYGGIESYRSLNEGGDTGRPPKVHVDDLRHYLGSLTESIPSQYRRRSGARDLDQLAARANFDDVDDFLDAWRGQIESLAQDKEYAQALKELRRNPDVIARAQAKVEKRRHDGQEAVAEFTRDRKSALLKNDTETVEEIESLIRAVEKEAGLKGMKFAKKRTIDVKGPRSKLTEYVATNYKDENSKDVSELIPLDSKKHTLKNGTVVDKDGRNVGSYVGIDDLGQQYAYLEGKPVNITGILGDIDMWGNMSKITWDMDRMIEKNAPDKATARRVQKFTTVFKDQQEATMKTEILRHRSELSRTERRLISNLPKGISKQQLSEDMFRVMEKKVSYNEILDRYGKKYVDEYMRPAIEKQRKEFDSILTETNASLVRNGFDEIPRRDDYITHIQEDPKFWEKVGMGISEISNLGSSINSDINPGKVRGAIPEEIVGNTANTNARRKWNPFAQTRRGSAHAQDFFAAVDAYYEPMLFNKYMTPAASRARLIERTFRTFDKAKEIRAAQLLDVTDMGTARDMAGLNKQRGHKQYKADRTAPFVLAWQEYGNRLAGKSNKWDRTLLESGNGQKFLKASTKLQGIAGANTIPGSATAALAQTLSLPQTLGRDSATSVAKGIKDAVYYGLQNKRVSKDGAKDPLMSSSFMRARYTDASSKRKTFMRRYTSKASVPMEAIERFTGEVSWRSAFAEARKKGLKFDDAIREADIETKKTLAGRGIGDRPLAMDSKAAGALTQFGLEVNNMRLQFWDDFTPAQKSKFIVSAFALNWLYSLVTGQTPLPDYLKATIDSFMDMLDWEDEDETLTGKVSNTAQRFAGETAKFIPGAGPMANFLPEDVKNGVFGSDSDVSRFGTMAFMRVPSAAKKALEGALTGDMGKVADAALMVTPTGQQARRSIEGVFTMSDGAAKTASGNMTTTVDANNPWKWLQAMFFGKNALSEVQGVYNNKSYAATKEQTQIYDKIKSVDGKESANAYLDRIKGTGGNGVQKGREKSNPSVTELKAKLDISIEKGDRYIEDGIVHKKDDAIDREYYKNKAAAFKDEKSEDAYKAYLYGYNLTTGTKYGKDKDVSTGSDLLDSLMKSEAKISAKDKSTASKAIGLFMDSDNYKNVPDWVKDRYYKDAGYTKSDVEYGALTKINKDTKIDVLYRPIAEQDHGKLLDTLWSHRKMSINNKYVAASDSIITQLQKEGYLSKAEAKTLKGAKLDGDMKNTVAASSSGGGSGRGRKKSGSGSTGAGKSDYTKADINQYIKSLSGSDTNDVASIIAKYSGKKFTTSFKAASSASKSAKSRKSASAKKAKVQLG